MLFPAAHKWMFQPKITLKLVATHPEYKNCNNVVSFIGVLVLWKIKEEFPFVCLPLMQPNLLKNKRTKKTLKYLFSGKYSITIIGLEQNCGGCPKIFLHDCNRPQKSPHSHRISGVLATHSRHGNNTTPGFLTSPLPPHLDPLNSPPDA